MTLILYIAIAIAVSFSAFSGREATQAGAVAILYGVGNFIFATSYALLALYLGWTYTPRDERNLLKIIAKNYQPREAVGDQTGESRESEITRPEL